MLFINSIPQKYNQTPTQHNVSFGVERFERIVIFSEETDEKHLTQKELYDTIRDKGGVHDV